jgi:hypothetical protein
MFSLTPRARLYGFIKRGGHINVKAAHLFEMQSKADAFSKVLYFSKTYDRMKVKDVV